MPKRTYIRSGGTWVDITSGAAFPASSAAPASPVTGQVYFDTDDQKPYIWNGTAWVDFVSGNISVATLNVSSTTDASPSSTGHGIQVGPTNGLNLRIDTNEIIALNNGVVSPLYLQSNGGVITVAANSAGEVNLQTQTPLRFYDADNTNYVALRAPTAVSADATWTLPSAEGTNGQVLETNGAGGLIWGQSGERVLLASAVAGTTDIVISNIPSTYADIEIIMWGTGALDAFLESFTMSTSGMDTSATAYAGFNLTAPFAGNDTSGAFKFPRATNFGSDGGSHNIGFIRMPDFSNKSGLNNKPRAMYGFALTPAGSASLSAFSFHCGLYSPTTSSAAVTGFTINRTSSLAILVYGIA